MCFHTLGYLLMNARAVKLPGEFNCGMLNNVYCSILLWVSEKENMRLRLLNVFILYIQGCT